MFTPSLLIDVLMPGIGFVGLALVALVRFIIHFKRNRWDDALTMLGLSFAFIAMWFTIISVTVRTDDTVLATHRHNCVMYELALQRNANPDLPDVPISQDWLDLECYPDP